LIFEQLSVVDILDLGLTSVGMYQAVSANRILPSRIRLTLSVRKVKQGNNMEQLLALASKRSPWRHCVLDVDGWNQEQLEKLKDVIKNMQSIELFTSKKLQPIGTADLANLILSITGLQSITFDSGLLCRDLTALIINPENVIFE